MPWSNSIAGQPPWKIHSKTGKGPEMGDESDYTHAEICV